MKIKCKITVLFLIFQKRGSAYKMPKGGRSSVINAIIDQLKDKLTSQSIESSLHDLTVWKKVNDLILEAEDWAKNKSKFIGNLTLLAEKQNKHGEEFDISGLSPKSIIGKRRYIDEDDLDIVLEVKAFY